IGARGFDKSANSGISLVADPDDPVASSPSAAWALQELVAAIAQRGLTVRRLSNLDQAPSSDLCIVAAGSRAAIAEALLKGTRKPDPSSPESLALIPSTYQGRQILLSTGSDARGLMYALLELADRVRHGQNPLQQLRLQKPIIEEPFNQVRSIGKLFVSDV